MSHQHQHQHQHTNNPFQRSSGPSGGLSSSAGYERSELDEFPFIPAAASSSPPLQSQHAVVSLQHHHQTLSSTHHHLLQPNIQDAEPEAGLLRLESSSSDEDDDDDLTKAAAEDTKQGGGVGGGRLGRWCPPLRPLGRLLRWLTPHIPTSHPGTGGSLAGYWFISAEQHVLEFVLVNLAFAGLLVFFGIDLASHGTTAPNKSSFYFYFISSLF
jgi:hypothetical protein